MCSKAPQKVPNGVSPRNSLKVVGSFDFLNEYHSRVMERLPKTDSTSYILKNGSNRICHMNSILELSDSLLCRACVDDNRRLHTLGNDNDLDSCLDETKCDSEKKIIHKYVERFKKT